MSSLAVHPPSHRYSLAEAARLDQQLRHATAEELLRWGLRTFGDRLVVASSFGAEDVVLIDLAVQIDPNVRVFTLDTGRLHQETYDVIDRVRDRYGIEVEVLLPDLEQLAELLRTRGPNSFYRSVEERRACCHIRKVEPLGRVLATADAWVTGLRREQSPTRTDVPRIELDLAHGGKLKLNPLADWTEDDVWAHIREHDVPYNALHDQGFPSIGCAPCTRAIAPGEDVRAGRWWWEKPDAKECGLHR